MLRCCARVDWQQRVLLSTIASRPVKVNNQMVRAFEIYSTRVEFGTRSILFILRIFILHTSNDPTFREIYEYSTRVDFGTRSKLFVCPQSISTNNSCTSSSAAAAGPLVRFLSISRARAFMTLCDAFACFVTCLDVCTSTGVTRKTWFTAYSGMFHTLSSYHRTQYVWQAMYYLCLVLSDHKA